MSRKTVQIDSNFLFQMGSYRQIPSFGRDSIRRFVANCSEMKKMVARDFENLLQVSMIIFLEIDI
jgi:hypothetical protein